jgi:hypothetical protein
MEIWLRLVVGLAALAFDRISKKALAAGLIEQNPFWGSWRGLRDKGQPHELTNGELSALPRR